MKVHLTDPLFGLDEWMPHSETIVPTDKAKPIPQDNEKITPHEPVASDNNAIYEDVHKHQYTHSDPLRRFFVFVTIFLLFSATALSLFSLAMKTQRRTISYELSQKTHLFSRISKHRAMLQLEYSYLRSTSPILEEFIRQGWKEVTPREVIHLQPKSSVTTTNKGNPTW